MDEMQLSAAMEEVKKALLCSNQGDILNNVMAVFLRVLLTRGPDAARKLFSVLDRGNLQPVALCVWTGFRHLSYEVTDHHVELAVDLRRRSELPMVSATQIQRACQDLVLGEVATGNPQPSRRKRRV